MTRRGFVSAATFAAVAGRRLAAFQAPAYEKEMQAILARIRPPQFPARVFDITKYGATPGAVKDCTEAIAKTVEACSKAGGGRVLVPRGEFLTGAIHLKSNVDLHLEDGSVLKFSTDPQHYLPLVLTRFEGTECMNYSPLIYAFEQTNVAVTGTGMLDGQANNEHWWPWVGNARFGGKPGAPSARPDADALVAMADKDVLVEKRVFGEGHYLRPTFVQPYRCTNVLIEDIGIRNSPMWEVNPVLSRNVTVRNVKIASFGPNNDGCDPESSTDVLVEGCVFETGDDCIAIKSGRNRDGRRVGVACENIIIRNCTMKDGHGGVSLGSEGSGGIHNVFVDHCRMDSPHLQRALRLKTNSFRGGSYENVYFTNITVGQVAEAVIEVDFFYPEYANREGRGGPFHPVVKNIVVEHVTSQKSKRAVYLRGYPDAPVSGVRIAHCTFNDVAENDVIENVKDLVLEDDTRNGKAMAR
ncbi:MAG TPA: glycoside hydrolase family 28 protein [Bryobacteraceae bacterium]|jgi:polygalacturonase|nr:glycoside hydrolase family 28 protein [Bryobacteraceae bacterium]